MKNTSICTQLAKITYFIEFYGIILHFKTIFNFWTPCRGKKFFELWWFLSPDEERKNIKQDIISSSIWWDNHLWQTGTLFGNFDTHTYVIWGFSALLSKHFDQKLPFSGIANTKFTIFQNAPNQWKILQFAHNLPKLLIASSSMELYCILKPFSISVPPAEERILNYGDFYPLMRSAKI